MLFEKTSYEDDFPINIRIMEIDEYPVHYHMDNEFVYILRGKIKLKNGYHTYILEEGDIFINSGHEVHGMKSTGEDNLVAVIQVSNWFFTRYFPSLPTACFRTYTRDKSNARLDNLRYMMLQILLNVLRRSFNYKSKCTLMMIDVIDYINKWFNLFSFDGDIVVDFGSDDPVIIGRISRIINYIYANHSGKITLEDIASREHLSSYYVSHLIRDYMGISFQEFLCFSRVESSEIDLLETDKKISAVARNAGFSTTAYYEKYFRKWFRRSPQEHREIFRAHTLSPEFAPKVYEPVESSIIPLLQRCLSALEGQNKNPYPAYYHQISVSVDPDAPSSSEIRHRLQLMVTPEDMKVMSGRFWSALESLNPETVIVTDAVGTGSACLQSIAEEIRAAGFHAVISENAMSAKPGYYGSDSVAAFHYIFKRHFASDTPVTCFLRDQGDEGRLLKGCLSCYTSCLIPKPAFFAYSVLSSLEGSLLYSDRYYSVIRSGGSDSQIYTILTMNYSDDIGKLCIEKNSPFEVNSIIAGFIDQVDINFHIPVTQGSYNIVKYTFGRENNIFSYVAELNFPEKIAFPENWKRFLTAMPHVEMSSVEAEDTIDLTLTAKGVSFQITVIYPDVRM